MDHIGDSDAGEWLATHRWQMDRGESAWLSRLAAFDLAQGWAADGQLGCAQWLMWRTGMARATAYEKLRIAHQLRRRNPIATAFHDGRISYSAVRALCRIDDPEPEVDQALVELAIAGSVEDVERMVRLWHAHADQHRPPGDAMSRRGLRLLRGHDGSGRIEITVTEVELEEVAATVQAYIDRSTESAAADCSDDPVGQSAGVDSSDDPVGQSAGVDCFPGMARSWPARRADAFMDLVRVALAHLGQPGAAAPDRYLVHVVTHADVATRIDGAPLDPAETNKLRCDCSVVQHTVSEAGEPLRLGRKTRTWSAAQRRAILVRDHGHCRFPGCSHRHVDIHHQQPWDHGGPTDISNGIAHCDAHHTLLHNGFTSVGDTNGPVTFYRPDGTTIGTTTPPGPLALRFTMRKSD